MGMEITNYSKVASNTVLVTSENKQINIQSLETAIENIKLFDLVGREVYNADGINKTEFNINNVIQNQQALIIKITLTDGTTVSKKLMN
jgi:hypothetical protein